MKLILIGLALILFPIATWIAEWWESDRHQQLMDILYMADHDRQAQAVRPMNRRMEYASIGKKNPRRRCSANRGARKTYAIIISLLGGLVK